MNDNEKAEQSQTQTQAQTQERLVFEGVRGRQPETDQELTEWLASPEGKAAVAFELTSLSPWGEKGRA